MSFNERGFLEPATERIDLALCGEAWLPGALKVEDHPDRRSTSIHDPASNPALPRSEDRCSNLEADRPVVDQRGPASRQILKLRVLLDGPCLLSHFSAGRAASQSAAFVAPPMRRLVLLLKALRYHRSRSRLDRSSCWQLTKRERPRSSGVGSDVDDAAAIGLAHARQLRSCAVRQRCKMPGISSNAMVWMSLGKS